MNLVMLVMSSLFRVFGFLQRHSVLPDMLVCSLTAVV